MTEDAEEKILEEAVQTPGLLNIVAVEVWFDNREKMQYNLPVRYLVLAYLYFTP